VARCEWQGEELDWPVEAFLGGWVQEGFSLEEEEGMAIQETRQQGHTPTATDASHITELTCLFLEFYCFRIFMYFLVSFIEKIKLTVKV